MYILSDMALSLCVSAIFLIFPPIFSVIARFERYEEPKNELYINMFRLANWLIHMSQEFSDELLSHSANLVLGNSLAISYLANVILGTDM